MFVITKGPYKARILYVCEILNKLDFFWDFRALWAQTPGLRNFRRPIPSMDDEKQAI